MTTSLLMSKIINISDARRRRSRMDRVVTMKDHDQRREFRRESAERLFVQIVKSDNQDLIGTTVSCAALDVSASGLKILANTMIPKDARLDLWVDNSAGPGKFFLSSDVRWSAKTERGWLAGVELQDGAATDIREWRQLHGYL